MRLIRGIVEYVFIILMILECNSVFLCAKRDYYIIETCTVMLLILVILNIGNVRLSSRELRKIFSLTIFYYLYCFVFIIFSVEEELLFTFTTRFMIFVPLVFFLSAIYYLKNKTVEIIRKFVNVTLFLCTVSLVFWIFGSLLNIIKPTGIMVARWGTDYSYISYYNLYFVRQARFIFGLKIIRNSSVFVEAPMYSLILCIALIFRLFILKAYDSKLKNRNRRIEIQDILLSMGCISTISTSSFLVLIMAFLLYYYSKSPKSRQQKLVKIVIGLVLSVVGIIVLNNIIVRKVSTTEGMVRLDDYIVGLKTWLLKPVFGHGYENNRAFATSVSTFRRNNVGMSNSVFAILVQGGIYLSCFYIIPTIMAIVDSIRKDNKDVLFMMIIFVVEFVITIFPYKLVMFYLISLFTSRVVLQRNIVKRKTVMT